MQIKETAIMDVFEAIRRRHSYRGAYEKQPVPREDLERIVQAGIQAPSGVNAQSTSFVIVDDPNLVARVADVIEKPLLREVPAIVVCAVDHRAVYQDMSFGIEDCAAAVENMLLAIAALGYATVWIDGALRRDGRATAIAGLLGVPDDLEVRIVLPVGVPAEHREQKEKKPFGERAWFNGWREN